MLFMLSDKIKLTKIIEDHLKTLYDNSDEKNKVSFFKGINIMPEDRNTFFILPFIFSFVLILIGAFLNNNVSNALLIAMSILIPVLISLLMLIYNIGRDLRNDDISPRLYSHNLKLLNQIKANISFTILMSIISLIFLILWSALSDGSYLSNIFIVPYGEVVYNGFMSLVIYWVIGINFLTLIMVLQRFYKLLSDSLE